MNLNENGWLKGYLTFRQNNLSGETKEFSNNQLPDRVDQRMYRTAQPTGIMYGHPIVPQFISSEFSKLSVTERMKVVFVENFIQSDQLDKDLLQKKYAKDFSYELATNLINYYLQVFPEVQSNTHTLSGKLRAKEEIAEQILNKRLLTKRSFFENFWSSYFHNSLLFIDVFYFRSWSEKKDGLKTIEDLRKGKDGLRLILLKTIAAAAYADKIIEKEEKKLFQMFLKSAKLDAKSEKEAKKFIDSEITLADIDFPKLDSWLLKKYILELAILTVWSDKIVNKQEHEFIQELGKLLGFSEEEINDSFTAIESFVLSNWDDIKFFLKNKDIQVVSKLFVKQITRIAKKNKNRITTEIKESKELMELLSVSTKRSLNAEEKEKVRAQLIDLLKILPTFVIIALPGTFLTLPILLKVLPKSAFPSAFQD